MPIYLRPYQLEVVDRLLAEAGLDRPDFGWWREDGSSCGHMAQESNALRHIPTWFSFTLVEAPALDADGNRLLDAEGAVLSPAGTGLYHVWGHVGNWDVPGSRQVPIPWSQLLDALREWVRQLAAHLGVSPQHPGAATPQYVFHGSVGVVQTGAGASATLLTPLSADGAAAFAHDLRVFLAQLGAHTELPAEYAAVIREAVAAALEEADKPAPNQVTLRGAAMGLATAVQALGSSPQAYTLIKAAAAHLGVPLP